MLLLVLPLLFWFVWWGTAQNGTLPQTSNRVQHAAE
jgi:hypothetical protein